MAKWILRILATADAAFLALFATDVWQMEGSLWYKLAGFLIQGLPAWLILAGLVAFWRKPLWAGVFFLALALAMTFYFQTYRSWDVFLVISGPVLLLGAGFLIFRK